MKRGPTTGACPGSGATTFLCWGECDLESLLRRSEPTFRPRPSEAAKTALFRTVVIIAFVAAVGCAEAPVSPPTQPVHRFNVYFNNNSLTDGTTICDAVFPVPRSAPATTNVAAAALEALFRGPRPEEQSRGYRSFFSERTSGLLKGLTIEAGTAYVDLHDRRRELASATSSCGSAEFFSQVEHTLGDFPGVDRIIFAIEGDPAVFYDWMELECNRSNDACDPAPFSPTSTNGVREPSFLSMPLSWVIDHARMP